ncbi:MAG: GTP-binding protein [Thermodesulfobacteriota bacterium]
MRLIIVAGFLGSGKTTLILSIASELVSRRGRKVVIVENEVGQIGIDDQYLELEGLRVKKLQSGCICCALASDLVTTLKQLQESFHPDVVILEPSGVANVAKILEIINDFPAGSIQKKVIVLVDPMRFKAIMAMTFPFVQESLNVADIVAINKIDLVEQVALDETRKEIKGLTGMAQVAEISALQGTGLRDLMEEVG